MTKAFDLVNYHELFLKLRSRISPIFLRLLCFVYLNQTACVAWGESNSDNFSVKNGVKQGAIFSPTLFSIYIDSLFEVLKKSGFGCFIKNDYYGALAYADDIVLLCPSIKGLQSMLDISKKFFDDLGLIISFDYADPQKSKTKCQILHLNSLLLGLLITYHFSIFLQSVASCNLHVKIRGSLTL